MEHHRDPLSVPLPPERVRHPAIARALEYIHTNYAREVALDDVADHAMLSKYHFSRLFHRVVGLTFQQYLIALRVRKARHLIAKHPYRNITSIAHRVGYGSLRGFELHFKRLEGETPSDFRERVRGRI